MELHPSLKVIDSSKLQEYMDCPRKFFYRHVLGWVPDRPAHALHFGTCIHMAMDALYSHGFNEISLELAKVTFYDAYRELFDESTDELYFPKSPSMAIELLDYYFKQYQGRYAGHETLYTEIAGSVPLLSGYRLHFRVDRLDRSKELGLYSIGEYKSTSRNDRMWRDQWLLSTQIGTYTHLLYSLYDPAEVYGVEIEGLIFQKKGIDLITLPCRRTPQQMLSWLVSTTAWCRALDRDLEGLRSLDLSYLEGADVLSDFPLNSQSCTKYFGCEFHPYCSSWSNPFHCHDKPPIGFVVDYWDPTQRPAKKEFNL